MSPDTHNVTCREFDEKDRSACMAIFQSLTPKYFKAGELEEFEAFLSSVDNDSCRYAVIEDGDGNIIACGGMLVDNDKGIASLCWEMVHQNYQGRGIGRFMLQARLGWLRDHPTLTHVVASASSHASGFFQKEGFEIYNTQSDYFGAGHDLHDMKLKLR